MLLVLAASVLSGFIVGIFVAIKEGGELASLPVCGIIFAIAFGMFFTSFAFFVMHLI